MMSFKAFLSNQGDTITDEEAIEKYAEYKLEFKRQHLIKFFVTHKVEDGFKQKYHPDDSIKRMDEITAASMSFSTQGESQSTRRSRKSWWSSS